MTRRTIGDAPCAYLGTSIQLARRFHGDEQGTISFLTVFAVLILVMLLGMVMNVGRCVDGKIRMQNAADSVAYSGGLVLARGLNTLAFTNHLMCEVFALTAFLREAQARNAETYVPEILTTWNQTAADLASSTFPKFPELSLAIPVKTPLELQMVRTYGDWVGAVVPNVLPVMEEILQREAIPQFQRSVVSVYPDLARAAAQELAEREGEGSRGRGTMVGALWRTSGRLVGGDGEQLDPSLPVIDPSIDTSHQITAHNLRDELARHHLREWNNAMLQVFDRHAKMCQFASLWRNFTCANLENLFRQFPNTNLPMLLREEPDTTAEQHDSNDYLDSYFTFVGVVYWGRLPALAPHVFRDPITGTDGEQADSVAFAEVRVYIPRCRLVYWRGDVPPIDIDASSQRTATGLSTADPYRDDDIFPGGAAGALQFDADVPTTWRVRREPGASEEWSLFNQRWIAQLVPATHLNLAQILQTPPPIPEFERQQFRLPDLGTLDSADISRINTH